jgi:hypothetical protein
MNVEMRVHIVTDNHNSSTRSHTSEEENRTRNRSKNCKCKQAFIQKPKYASTKVI